MAANRDEFHARPTARAHWWNEARGVFGGRDLSAGGGWLALHSRGRLAALTNYRDRPRLPPLNTSRGTLLTDYLLGTDLPETHAQRVLAMGHAYAGFNLLLFDWRSGPVAAAYVSNRTRPARPTISPGIHGISNHLLGTPWPKVERLRSRMQSALRSEAAPTEALFDALADRRPIDATEHASPIADDDVMLRTPFIADASYGTRASTVITLEHDGTVQFIERSWAWHDGAPRLEGERAVTLRP